MSKKDNPIGFGASGGPGQSEPNKKAKSRGPLRVKGKLTPRDRKFAKLYMEGEKSGRQCALEADFPVSMANKLGAKVLTPAIIELISDRLDKVGCTDEHLAQRIMEGTNAEVVKFATFEGRISDERTYVDMEQRGKYIDRALELKGHTKRGGAAVEVNMPVTLVHSVPRPGKNING